MAVHPPPALVQDGLRPGPVLAVGLAAGVYPHAYGGVHAALPAVGERLVRVVPAVDSQYCHGRPLHFGGAPFPEYGPTAAAVAQVIGCHLHGVLFGRGTLHLHGRHRIFAAVLQRHAQLVQGLVQHARQVLGVAPARVGDAERQDLPGLLFGQHVELDEVALHLPLDLDPPALAGGGYAGRVGHRYSASCRRRSLRLPSMRTARAQVRLHTVTWSGPLTP